MDYIHSINYINGQDLDKLIGIHWNEFEFAQMAENGSYVYLRLDEDAFYELQDEIEWELGRIGNNDEQYYTPFLKRLLNQQKLMEFLCEEYGLRDGVLIHIFW